MTTAPSDDPLPPSNDGSAEGGAQVNDGKSGEGRARSSAEGGAQVNDGKSGEGRARSSAEGDAQVNDEPVIKLPRGRGLTLDKSMMFRIAGTLAVLVMIVVTARPCGEATSRFVNGFDEQKGSNTAVMPTPGNVDEPQHYERLKSGMTDDEVRAAIERAKRNGAGPAAGSGSGSGSGATPSLPHR